MMGFSNFLKFQQLKLFLHFFSNSNRSGLTLEHIIPRDGSEGPAIRTGGPLSGPLSAPLSSRSPNPFSANYSSDSPGIPFQFIENQGFSLLPIQELVYNTIMPHPDDAVPTTATVNLRTGRSHQIHEAYLINERYIDLSKLKSVVTSMFTNLEVLRSYLFRNDRIIDADVEGFIEHSSKVKAENVIHRLESTRGTSAGAGSGGGGGDAELLTAEEFAQHVQAWLDEKGAMRPTFEVLYMDNKVSFPDGPEASYIALVASSVVADDHTVTAVSKYMMSLYLEQTTKSPNLLEDGHMSLANFAGTKRVLLSNNSRKAKSLDFYKSQCIEVHRHSVSDSEKDNIETKIEKLKIEKERTRELISNSKKAKAEMEGQLDQMRQQRIDLEMDAAAPQTSFVDPFTFETIYIPLSYRQSLLYDLLGDSLYGENIGSYLELHGITEGSRQIVASSQINTMEEFCALIESKISSVQPKEIRKVMKLSENLRNRVREALQDHKALKFTLERKIAKLERELKQTTSKLHTLQKQFESADDYQIQLELLLNPKDKSDKVSAIRVDRSLFESDASNYYEFYDHILFTVNDDVLKQLRQFQDYLCSLEGKTALEKSSVFDEDVASSRPASGATGTAAAAATATNSPGPNVSAVCLATFGVILKHISGFDKFLVGVKQDYRDNTILGNLSDTLPIKLDYSAVDKSFNSIVLELWSAMKESKTCGLSCPSLHVKEALGVKEFPVCFEMVSDHTLGLFSEFGVDADDLLHRGVINDKLQRLWSYNEMNQYEIKLKIVDCGNQLKCIFSYKKDLYDYEKACRWVDKFESALWQIEYGSRKLTPNNMISRLYNAVWQSSSANNLGSGSFGSSINIRSESVTLRPSQVSNPPPTQH